MQSLSPVLLYYHVAESFTDWVWVVLAYVVSISPFLVLLVAAAWIFRRRSTARRAANQRRSIQSQEVP